MANKIFLRVNAWYRASAKYIPDDIEITPIVVDENAQYPEIEDVEEGDGGPASDFTTAYASNSEAVAALGVGVLYKSTDTHNDSPIILITV